MGLNVGDLFAELTLHDSQFRSGLRSAQTAFQSAGKKFTGAGKALTAGVTAPIAGLAMFGLKYNATMQDLETSFKVMLGSQEKALVMVKKLKDMGAKTPFDATQLAEYTKTMLSFGYTGDNVLPIMSRLGDVSLGNNAKMSSLARTMGQINSLGRLQGGDLNQLIGQAWNPLDAIIKKTGETMEEVIGRMQKGKITYKEVEQALVDTTSKGGKFFNGMAEGSKTMTGQISTLKDVFGAFVGELTKPIFDAILAQMPNVIKFVERLSATFTTLSPTMKTVILVTAGIAAVIGPLLLGIGGLLMAGGALMGIFSGIAAAIGFVLSPIGLVIAAVIGLGAMFVWLMATNSEFRANVLAVWEEIKTRGAEIWEVMKTTALEVWTSVSASLTEIWGAIAAIAQEVFTRLKAFWAEWGDSIINIIKAAWVFIGDVFSGAFQIIAGLFNVFAGLFTGDWNRVWTGIKSIISGAWTIIKGIFKFAFAYVDGITKGALSKWWSSFKVGLGKVKKVFTSIFNGIKKIVGNSIKWITDKIDAVKEIAGGVGSAISGSISTARSWWPFAAGTNYAPGGMALVGERGPELINLPRGSRVFNNRETNAMSKGGSNGGTMAVSVSGTVKVDTSKGMETLNSRAVEKIVSQAIINNSNRFKR